ncbi:MAG: hypothetical protein D6733_07250 [Methanobacteriota archaeon]|nr:MAG: hypothetical protein D6733_07250 [Euryarchaeota archaeon]
MIQRVQELKVSSVVRRVPEDLFGHIEPRRKRPERGDVVVCSVSKVGWHRELENRFGRYRRLFEGDRVVVAIGNRYATGEFEGKIPERVRYGMELLNAGGVCGKLTGKNLLIQDPTKLLFMGYVVSGGEVVNLRDHALGEKDYRREVPVVLVVGSGMDAGKTTTAATIIKALVTAGHRVCAGKVTGTARSKDILLMSDAGADLVLDHVDAGYPSTYKCQRKQVMEIIDVIYSNLASEDPDYIVIEIADGVFQRETKMILREGRFMDRVSRIFFSASDSLAAYGGHTFFEELDLEITAFSGPVANSRLMVREVYEHTGLPCIAPKGRGSDILALIHGGGRSP